VLLYHVHTGAIREGPWIALRPPDGCIFFAILVCKETRWFPPRNWNWMSDWVFRAKVEFGPFAGLQLEKQLLPVELARRRVEGGAPYLLDPSNQCKPRYAAEPHDSPQTYPMVHGTPAEPKVRHCYCAPTGSPSTSTLCYGPTQTQSYTDHHATP
jgi:hypothetical protein